jgi:hypothetical protein
MNVPEFQIKLQNAVNEINRLAADVLFLGGKNLEGEMKFRIFNQGRATTGQIGNYKSKSWIQKRGQRGRQTNYVDLEFTSSLRDSIQVVRQGNDVFLAVINDKDFAKAKGQESRRKKEIFIPSESERKQTEIYISDLIAEKLTNLL